jgi:hypothetical protein
MPPTGENQVIASAYTPYSTTVAIAASAKHRRNRSRLSKAERVSAPIPRRIQPTPCPRLIPYSQSLPPPPPVRTRSPPPIHSITVPPHSMSVFHSSRQTPPPQRPPHTPTPAGHQPRHTASSATRTDSASVAFRPRAIPRRDIAAWMRQRTRVREASRSHASDSPAPGEDRISERPGPSKNIRRYPRH